jgi:hypothetical protein
VADRSLGTGDSLKRWGRFFGVRRCQRSRHQGGPATFRKYAPGLTGRGQGY